MRPNTITSGRVVAFVVLLAGVVLAASAVATATIPGEGGVIHGCYKNSNGALRVIDDASADCASNETALSWAQGQPGGLSGLEVVEAESEFNSFTLDLASAVCPAGKKAIGGGGVARAQFATTPFALVASRPDPTVPEAWTAVGKEMSATDDTHALTAWVYCASAS